MVKELKEDKTLRQERVARSNYIQFLQDLRRYHPKREVSSTRSYDIEDALRYTIVYRGR